jgi:tRNA (cmo5U34)-methyltransferase
VSGPASASQTGPPPPLTGYDGVAGYYDALSRLVFGPTLQQAQEAALAGLPAGAPRVLILGGGSGWVLTELLRRRPTATVLYLEASPRMLARAQAQLRQQAPAQLSQVEFRHGTQADLRPAETFDVLITFFVLDCLSAAEVGPALRRLNQARQPGAPWLLADFRPPQRWWQHLLLRSMYLFFRLTTGLEARQLPLVQPALEALGLRVRQQATFLGGAVEATVFS